MSILLYSNNLMAVAPIRGAADRLGTSLLTASTTDELRRHCEPGGVELVLLDLATPNLDPHDLVPKLRAATVPAVVAFGPHVHEQRLRNAAEAGCDEVLTQGQLHGQVETVIARYVSRK